MTQRVERPSARILLLDPEGRVLLFRFDFGDRPPFWATPGGALDPGEDYAAGARRELLEETGLDMECGPQVARRLADFATPEGVEVTADERYFLVRTDRAEIGTAGHTELERRVMRSWRWFSRADIAAHDEPIFPEDLLAMLRRVEQGAGRTRGAQRVTQVDIGVRRLGERGDSFAMVPAQNVAANVWVILDNDVEREEGCALEFKPGNLVTLMGHKDADGFEYEVAMRLYAGTIP